MILQKQFWFLCLGYLFLIFHIFAQKNHQQTISKLVESFYRARQNKQDSEAIRISLELARLYYREQNVAQAILYYQKASELGNSYLNPQVLAGIYDTLGDLYKKNKNYESALTHYKNASELYGGQLYDMKRLASVLYKAAEIYQTRKDFNNAISFYERVFEISENQSLTKLQYLSAQKLYELYKMQNYHSKSDYYASILQRLDAPSENLITKSSGLIIGEKNPLNKVIILVGILGVVLIVLAIGLNFQTIKRLKKQNDQIKIQNKQIEDQKRELVAEKEETERLMESIFPKHIVAELKRNGVRTSSGSMVVKPQIYENCSVLFTDFKGFTQLAEIMSPEQVIEELNTCFSAFDDIIGRFRLEKIKTIGDAYMCAAGVPVPMEDHAVAAVSAGLEMLKFMDIYRAQKISKGLPYFDVRIGIHSGRVIAGIVGTRKFAYDIWGDTVNTAARMEQSGKERYVNISEETYQLVKHAFECEYRGEVPVKHKGNISMYFVLRKKM
ncbi:MAG: tetratricopeptide repeat protein [Cytophagales bacterium]|nr:tetratricopeptide repeat protein [Cytophagales bacterium]MDW8384095.1 adenylate/guanylate cyclase domain-containing protein [Flammeovirgaceae bacterium]